MMLQLNVRVNQKGLQSPENSTKKFGGIRNVAFNPHRNGGNALVEAGETIISLSDNRTGVCAKTLDF